MFKSIIRHINRNTIILYKVAPFIIFIICIKLTLHNYGFEFISLNAIFSGLIGATVFLMGFLLSGVLSDYKESEKLPGELAAILETMSDEMNIIYSAKHSNVSLNSLQYLYKLSSSIKLWFFKKEKNHAIMTLISGLNEYFLQFESLTQANFISRLKQEQHNLRKIIIRIHTIRETNFVLSGYFLAYSVTILLILGLIFSKIEPFYESLFFVCLVSYILIFLLFLIRDLDNPFGFYENGSSEDVSLKPLDNVIKRLEHWSHDPSSKTL